MERCENSFVDYRINYQKLCYLMRQITKDFNSANSIIMYRSNELFTFIFYCASDKKESSLNGDTASMEHDQLFDIYG